MIILTWSVLSNYFADGRFPPLDLIANKRMSRRGVFPFRFRGSCRLEPCFDGEVAPEIVQSAGGFDEGVLKADLEVAINVTDATEDLDSGDTVLDAHP